MEHVGSRHCVPRIRDSKGAVFGSSLLSCPKSLQPLDHQPETLVSMCGHVHMSLLCACVYVVGGQGRIGIEPYHIIFRNWKSPFLAVGKAARIRKATLSLEKYKGSLEDLTRVVVSL